MGLNNKRNIILSSILLFFGLTFFTFGIIILTLIKINKPRFIKILDKKFVLSRIREFENYSCDPFNTIAIL